jgi:hypothetical protein
MSSGFDVAANLESVHRSNDLFQSLASLHDGPTGKIGSIAPKEIEQVKAYGRGRALLPSLE